MTRRSGHDRRRGDRRQSSDPEHKSWIAVLIKARLLGIFSKPLMHRFLRRQNRRIERECMQDTEVRDVA